VNGKVVLGVLAVIGTLTLSATVAQAGGRGVPAPLTSFFTCHTINGASLGTKVDVYSNEVGAGPPTALSRANVTIGQAILACAQVLLFHAGVTPTEDPDTGKLNDIDPAIPSPTPGENLRAFELKCYTASVSKKTGGAGSLTLEDALFFDAFGTVENPTPAETLPVERDPKLICAPASPPPSP